MSIVIRGKSDLSSKEDDELAEIIIIPGDNSLLSVSRLQPLVEIWPSACFLLIKFYWNPIELFIYLLSVTASVL